jgi:hypothetical protein
MALFSVVLYKLAQGLVVSCCSYCLSVVAHVKSASVVESSSIGDDVRNPYEGRQAPCKSSVL